MFPTIGKLRIATKLFNRKQRVGIYARFVVLFS